MEAKEAQEVELNRVHQVKPDPHSYPKISIITPSYNQGNFIEDTIQSILSQNYPNLEYVIIDGGSKDQSVGVIQKYSGQLAYWVSEPDRGQADAINKGLSHVTGEIIGWVNSDDLLKPNSLSLVAKAHQKFPDQLIVGDVIDFSIVRDSEVQIRLVKQQGITLHNFVCFWEEKHFWHQVGIFFPGALIRKVGPIDETLRYAFDHDLMCRFLQHAEVHYLHEITGMFRLHDHSKTVAEGQWFLNEVSEVSKRYWHLFPDIRRKDHDRYYAAQLLRMGIWRLKIGKPDGLKLILASCRMDPFISLHLVKQHLMKMKTL